MQNMSKCRVVYARGVQTTLYRWLPDWVRHYYHICCREDIDWSKFKGLTEEEYFRKMHLAYMKPYDWTRHLKPEHQKIARQRPEWRKVFEPYFEIMNWLP